ncbi:unnamed protein product [Staurois parvus]|uniref:Uncharacterized protein n=1 Tax=Staurois parvus TaxID=386267 RepID=A0ABN9EGM6_9NEOB|nr:unnamed protein product [Staurois parvus]
MAGWEQCRSWWPFINILPHPLPVRAPWEDTAEHCVRSRSCDH